MGMGNQSNNRYWGKKDNLAAAREFFFAPEINDFSTSSAESNEYPSDNYSPYEDSDIGSSLQEVKHEGDIALADKKRSKKAPLVAAIAVSSIGAIVVINQIAETKPLIENHLSEVVVVAEKPDYKLLTYDFTVTYKGKASLFIDLVKDGETYESKFELKWDSDSEDVETDGLTKKMRFTNVDEKGESPFRIESTWTGEYEFRVYSQFGFGKNSLISYRDRI